MRCRETGNGTHVYDVVIGSLTSPLGSLVVLQCIGAIAWRV